MLVLSLFGGLLLKSFIIIGIVIDYRCLVGGSAVINGLVDGIELKFDLGLLSSRKRKGNIKSNSKHEFLTVLCSRRMNGSPVTSVDKSNPRLIFI